MRSGGGRRSRRSPMCLMSRPATGRPFSNSKPNGRRARATPDIRAGGGGVASAQRRPASRAPAMPARRNRSVALDLDALAGCFVSPACLVTQTTSGLIIGMLLFLVAVGLTLILGVLKVVEF